MFVPDLIVAPATYSGELANQSGPVPVVRYVDGRPVMVGTADGFRAVDGGLPHGPVIMADLTIADEYLASGDLFTSVEMGRTADGKYAPRQICLFGAMHAGILVASDDRADAPVSVKVPAP